MEVRISAGLDCEAVSTLHSVVIDSWVCQIHAAHCSMNTHMAMIQREYTPE